MRKPKIATYRTLRGAEAYAARCARLNPTWEFRVVPEPRGFNHAVGAFFAGRFRAYVLTGARLLSTTPKDSTK